MANDTQIMMKVPEEVITAQVQAAVAMVLNKDPERLVAAVVEAAMNQKRDSYNRTTIWEDKLNEMIREIANACAKEWLDEQRPKIRAACMKRLGEKSKLVDTIADKLVSTLTTSIGVHLTFRDER